MMKTFKDVYLINNNAFDILRFGLAVLVIYSHCYPLLYYHSEEIVMILTRHQTYSGSVAIDFFLIISGFLVMQSYQNSQSLTNYLIKRALRIIPAFLTSLLLIAIILGPLFTHMDTLSYFKSGGAANPFAFVALNITFNLFGYSWSPQDLFALSVFPGSANGSMWTLKHEVAMYFVLPIAAWFLFFRIRFLMFCAVVVSFVLASLNIMAGFQLLHLIPHFWVLGQFEYDNFIKLSYYFLSGALCYLYADRIYYSKRLLLLALIGIIITNKAGMVMYGLMLFSPYLVIGIGTGFKLSAFRKYGDFSYGMYIYAFPCQQTLVYLWKDHLTISRLFFLSFLCTLTIAVLSWHYIEQPALHWKARLANWSGLSLQRPHRKEES